MTEYVEMSDELVAAYKAAYARAEEIMNQLRMAEGACQQLLDDAVASITEFKVGQDVLVYGHHYRITRVRGELFGLTGQRPKVWLRYSGQKVKTSGALFGKEKWLHDPQAIEEE